MKKTALSPLLPPLWIALATVLGASTAHAQAPAASRGVASTDLSTVGPSLNLTVGKSKLIRMPSAVSRISLGDPKVADVTLISPTELYLLGKAYGSTNLFIWRSGAVPTAIDVNVDIDPGPMEAKILEVLPTESRIKVKLAANSVILTGTVSSATKARAAEDIANAYVREANRNLVLPTANDSPSNKTTTSVSVGGGGDGGAIRAGNDVAGAKVVNLLQIAEAQQVMLEVKIAEVSKTLLDKFGFDFARLMTSSDGLTSRFISGIIGGGSTVLGQFNPNLSANISGSAASAISAGSGALGANLSTTGKGASLLNIDLAKKDGLVKILAEPNIVAISGQEASFLAGGTIFIPVPDGEGGTKLEEREFGVGLKFTPTVLEGGRIHLKVAPEVSELNQSGSSFSTVGGQTSILPSFTKRRVQTAVQLMDGQSLAIAGLIRNNVTEAVNKVPGLGEVPVLGALFRSSEFQGDRSELMFVITPRLIKPLDPNYILPTDSFTPPDRRELYFGNKLEGSGHEDIPPDQPGAPVHVAPVNATGGMEVK